MIARFFSSGSFVSRMPKLFFYSHLRDSIRFFLTFTQFLTSCSRQQSQSWKLWLYFDILFHLLYFVVALYFWWTKQASVECFKPYQSISSYKSQWHLVEYRLWSWQVTHRLQQFVEYASRSINKTTVYRKIIK